jgi:competence protein ComEC
MVALSLVSIALVWMMLHPAGVKHQVMTLHRSVMLTLEYGARRKHGKLEVSKETSGRNHLWLLPKTPGPRASRRTPSAGAMRRRPPSF